MQKWEYCVIGAIENLSGYLWASDHPKLTMLTEPTPSVIEFEGRSKLTGVTRKQMNNVTEAIMQLGNDGWEMVGCGNIAESSHFLYFKRPVP